VPDQVRHIQIAQASGETASGHAAEASEGASEKGHAGTAHHGGHHEYKLGDIPAPAMLFWNAVVVAVFMVVMAKAITRNLKSSPQGLQNFGEWMVESFVRFTTGIIGHGGEKYTPLVGTVFLYILFGNLIGLIPFMSSPTSNLSTTLALGLIIFVYVQYIGIKANGFGGYIKHFMGPMPALSPLLFPVEVISEIVKPFTLAMRLFGNIFGEDTVVIVLSGLAVSVLPKAPILPLQFPILVLGLLTAFVQALVFSLLTCIYISLQSHHDDDAEAHGHGHGHAVEGAH